MPRPIAEPVLAGNAVDALCLTYGRSEDNGGVDRQSRLKQGVGAVVGEQVFTMLAEAGQRHGFDVMDLTGTSFDDSLTAARENRALYDYLVVVGGDGMIALGANAVCGSGIPLGIVAVGSGNDFARGLKLPVNRVKTAVEGIVGAIACGT